MEVNDDELHKFLNPNEKLGKLRRLLVAFLLRLEDIREILLLVDGNEPEELNLWIEKINSLVHDFAEVQRIADRTIIDFSISKRKTLYKELPEAFEIFGWKHKTDENDD